MQDVQSMSTDGAADSQDCATRMGRAARRAADEVVLLTAVPGYWASARGYAPHEAMQQP